MIPKIGMTQITNNSFWTLSKAFFYLKGIFTSLLDLRKIDMHEKLKSLGVLAVGRSHQMHSIKKVALKMFQNPL